MRKDYYIYRHVRKDTNTPCYVGKGCARRAWSRHNRNPYHTSLIKKGIEVEIILFGLTEEEAFSKEVEFIKLYKDGGFCEANFSNGGTGNSGHRHSESTKKKLGRKGKTHHMYGKTHTDAAKATIGRINSEKRRKWIFQTPIGKFNHAEEAGKALGVSGRTIYTRCNKGTLGYNLIKYKLGE